MEESLNGKVKEFCWDNMGSSWQWNDETRKCQNELCFAAAWFCPWKLVKWQCQALGKALHESLQVQSIRVIQGVDIGEV